MKLKVIAAILTITAGAVSAQSVDVKDAWARATVKGQMATGAFMTLTAKDGAKLVSVASPVAGVVEVHEMKMDGNVMKMRAVQGGLDLPAGKAVELKPGGYHLMLMDLKAPLAKGASVPLTLVFQDAKGVQSQQQVQVPVAASAPAGQAGQGMNAAPAHGH